MKKYFLIICSTLICIGIVSCNGNSNKTENSDTTSISSNSDTELKKAITYNFENFDISFDDVCKNPTGLANFLVTKADGHAMTSNFDDIYLKDDSGKPIRTIDKDTWVDAKTISDIVKYMRINNNDGIRIFMACEANPDSQYGQDQYKNKVKILILPTVFKTTADPKVSEHLTDMKSKLEIYATSGNIESYSSTILKKNYFDKIYRKNPGTGVKPSKDSLSQSIWIDSCVIVTLDNILKNNPTTHDGVNFSMAAYKTKNPKLQSQLYPNQSTVILIPTKPNASGSHDSDWAIIEAFIRAKIYKAVSAGLNHGELCPTKCN